MIAKTELVFIDFSGVVASFCQPVGSTGGRGTAAGTGGCGELSRETMVHPEIVRECGGEWRGIVRECGREWRGALLDPTLHVAAGNGNGGESVKFTVGGEPGSAMSW
jgi:hypothetical protein